MKTNRLATLAGLILWCICLGIISNQAAYAGASVTVDTPSGDNDVKAYTTHSYVCHATPDFSGLTGELTATNLR